MSLRSLPSVDALAREFSGLGLPGALVAEVCRHAVDEARSRMVAGEEDVDPASLAGPRLDSVVRSKPARVVNATGVMLHTNLGRAPLADDAAAAASAAALGYGNIEFDLDTGSRGRRGSYALRLLETLTGAEAALVVNNNAAALYLVLHALAKAREVPVSRGELIEIGGSYRLPELMAATGATLREIGTTNRTRLADYRDALNENTAVLLKVHPSNYRVAGFSEDTSAADLSTLAAEADIPLVFDIGSGLLDEEVPWIPGPPPTWLNAEPGVRQSLSAGVDVVTFSGDKLLGGPQAGILVGRADLIETLRKDPITRALRCDASTMAALTATLELYLSGRALEVPFWRMAALPAEEISARAHAVLTSSTGKGTVSEGESMPGAGSVPGATLPTAVITLAGSGDCFDALLRHDPPVVARREAGDLILDLRTVAPEDDDVVAAALGACR